MQHISSDVFVLRINFAQKKLPSPLPLSSASFDLICESLVKMVIRRTRRFFCTFGHMHCILATVFLFETFLLLNITKDFFWEMLNAFKKQKLYFFLVFDKKNYHLSCGQRPNTASSLLMNESKAF